MGGYIMASTINADTTNGVVVTSDTSGEIKLQSAGADVATIDSSGLSMGSGMKLTSTGHILQVVNYNTTTTFSTAARSLTNVTGFNVTLTPASTTSKILVFVNFRYGNNTSAANKCALLRDAVDIPLGGTSNNLSNVYIGHGSTTQGFGSLGFSYLDSPSTTSAVTYQLQVTATAGTFYVNNRNDGSATSEVMGSMTAMEVAG